MSKANNTAFLMGQGTILKLKRILSQKDVRLEYNLKSINDLIDELSFILDQYPILINHQIWDDVEKKFILEKLTNPNFGALAIKIPYDSRGSEVLIIDYSKNITYAREQKK